MVGLKVPYLEDCTKALSTVAGEIGDATAQIITNRRCSSQSQGRSHMHSPLLVHHQPSIVLPTFLRLASLDFDFSRFSSFTRQPTNRIHLSFGTLFHPRQWPVAASICCWWPSFYFLCHFSPLAKTCQMLTPPVNQSTMMPYLVLIRCRTNVWTSSRRY